MCPIKHEDSVWLTEPVWKCPECPHTTRVEMPHVSMHNPYGKEMPRVSAHNLCGKEMPCVSAHNLCGKAPCVRAQPVWKFPTCPCTTRVEMPRVSVHTWIPWAREVQMR